MNYIYTLPSFACNKNCPYCISDILNKTTKEDDYLNIGQYISKLPLCDYFILSGNGEPSLYSYDVLKYIVDTVNKSYKFNSKRVQTSGLLFNQIEKLKLFDGWIKEITVVSTSQQEDMNTLGYKNEYFNLLPTVPKTELRVNYTMLLNKYTTGVWVEEVNSWLKEAEFVAIKLLDFSNQYIEHEAVKYSEVDNIKDTLDNLYSVGEYNKVGRRYEWFGGRLSMSYGKVNNPDIIQIERAI